MARFIELTMKYSGSRISFAVEHITQFYERKETNKEGVDTYTVIETTNTVLTEEYGAVAVMEPYGFVKSAIAG